MPKQEHRKNKITILFSSFQSNLSGAPRSLFHIIDHLDKSRFDCHVVFQKEGLIVPEFRDISAVHILSLYQNKKLPARVKIKVRDIKFRHDITQLINRLKPDVIFLNTVGQNMVSRYALQSDIPTILYYHEIDNTVMGLTEEWREQLTKASLSIGCSQAVTDFIIRCLCINQELIITIPESIPVHAHQAKVTIPRNQLLESINISESDIVLGTLGKPSFRKGADLLVDAAYIVLQNAGKQNLHFCWIGGNDHIHQSQLIRCLKQRVINLGIDNHFHWIKEVKSAASWTNALDAYIVPSREDPFPLGMLEAMALGKPVVGFAVNGIPEAVNNTGGNLVYGVSAARLAEGILDMLSQRQHWLDIGKLSQEKVIQKFDIVQNIQKYEDAIFRVLEN